MLIFNIVRALYLKKKLKSDNLDEGVSVCVSERG